MRSRLQLDVRNLILGRRHLVNAYEVKAGIGVIAGNTVWSMPERLECEVLQKVRYINTRTFAFIHVYVMRTKQHLYLHKRDRLLYRPSWSFRVLERVVNHKTNWTEELENDASTRLPNLTSTSCDLDPKSW